MGSLWAGASLLVGRIVAESLREFHVNVSQRLSPRVGLISIQRKKGAGGMDCSGRVMATGRLRAGVVFLSVGMSFQIPEQDVRIQQHAATNPISSCHTKQFTGLLVHIIRIIDLIITDYAV